ncbi:hypothetical protein RSOLAG22IIIB_09697 [Rhizoctonia solani]|uniref:Uncharacterized protein n=1 Tax=Rhizoctonia solani TaxID=456999 RepID=A0A0K6G035_9AGAM|nr:hypothetical protein RSOLAG22IIIB_09697 [Rhizoctonia solani]
MATKASKHPNNFKPKIPSAPELASLPRLESARSLQRLGAKRGTIRPILNHEPIASGARVDPKHPAAALSDNSFRAPYATNDYFTARAYPNAMLKRLGVVIGPSGRFKPRPPPEREFPILKHKRIKFARTYIMPIKSTHKSGVVRIRLKRKLNEAIQLVVTRGADADHQAEKVIFKPPEALESKWLLRDWYYVFYPRTPIYHAPWPSLIQVVRKSLLAIVKQGREMDMHWNLEIADREANAMARLSRREMRRVRMWRRQDQEMISRGHLPEDLGVRWKLEGTGPKKRSAGKGKPGAGNRRVKTLRAPTRSAFQRGSAANPSVGLLAPRKSPMVPKLEQLPTKVSSPLRPTTHTEPQAETTRAGVEPRTSRNSRTAQALFSVKSPSSTPKSSDTPKSSKGIPKLSSKPRGSISTMPPTKSLADSLRRKPQSKSASESDLKPPNRD